MKINVAVRLNPGFGEDEKDEVFVFADDPLVNFVMHLPKSVTKDLGFGSGLYELSLTSTEKKGKSKEAPQEG
jgi:hypothetical protein